MYGLPANLDLSFLHGRVLLQLCVGQNEVILNFDQDVSITVTSSIAFTFADGTYRHYTDWKEAAHTASALLGHQITSAKRKDGGTLCVKFDVDWWIEVFDDSQHYESYSIQNGRQLIVV
jgi:cytoskeletal protein RodZ